jgi:NAD(P)H-dependent FMN reductase
MKIVAFGASASKQSINKQFAIYAANQFRNTEIEILDLNNYPLPIFTVDLESEDGIPDNAKHFYDKLQTANLIIISLAEHNGTYTSAFKNLFDWVSRHQTKMFAGRKMFLLSTSTGARGGQGSMEAALSRFPRHGAEIIDSFIFPSFQENFDLEKGITNEELKQAFHDKVKLVKSFV